MSTRSILTVVGGVVGAYFGYPQLGLTIGALVGSAVDPQQIQGPKIGEIAVQTSQEGAPRTIVYGTVPCFGNVIQTGQVVKVEDTESQGKGGGAEVTSERALRTYAIRICEGPIAGVLRVWQDNKLVYDIRPGSGMLQESAKWLENKVFYLGDESQLPDPTLVASVDSDSPSYRGTAYFVAVSEDLTDRTGSIPQYRFEVSKTVTAASWPGYTWSDEVTASWTSSAALATSGTITIASGQGPNAYASTDLADWVTATIPFGLSFLAYGGGLFIGINTGNNNQVARSPDGFTWDSSVTMPTIYQKTGIAYGNGRFVAVGNYSIGPTLQRSTVSVDGGASWTNYDAIGSGFGTGQIRFCASQFVCLCDSSRIITSSDGITWATHTGPFATMSDVVYSVELGLYIVVGGTSLSTSPDLATWTARTIPAGTYHAIAWAAELGLFAIVGAGGVFATSPDAVTWTAHATLPGYTYTDLVWVGGSLGKFVAASQSNSHVYVSDTVPGSVGGEPVELSLIVSDIHDRCGIESTLYDVSELTDDVEGFSLAGDYTGASAIDSLRTVYFFDKSEHDKKLWYPKRGAAVVETLTVDDLTEVPDNTRRNQAIEVPKKLHLRYQHARSGYAPVKATAASSSPDFLTTGEVAIETAVVLDENEAAQTADKMYKITRTEIGGPTEITVPLDVGARYVTGNNIGLSLRGQTTRQRIEQIDFADWKLKITTKPDRQSAYTSNLTGVPIPEPTLPPSTIVGPTELAILDISARIDSEDDLNYLVAVSGRLPPWYGARYQRSLDGGASYATVLDIEQASIMGEITNTVTDASEFFTDTTNTVNVVLYRDNQSIDSITNTQFLSEGGAFVLEKSDGSWEIMQYRDAVEESDGSFTLSTLHRGMLNSGTSSHASGDRFVMLPRPSHIPAQAAWLNTDLTHRAISIGETADDTINQVTIEFVGRSQIEWPVEYLDVEEDSAGLMSGTWVPRYRFGTDANPINSINMTGYRVTIDDGSSSLTFDTTVPNFSAYDASALGENKTVTVAALNRITGPGEESSVVV